MANQLSPWINQLGGPTKLGLTLSCKFTSHDVFTQWFLKVDSPTKFSTSCLLPLTKRISWQFGGRVDFLKRINQYILWDESANVAATIDTGEKHHQHFGKLVTTLKHRLPLCNTPNYFENGLASLKFPWFGDVLNLFCRQQEASGVIATTQAHIRKCT